MSSLEMLDCDYNKTSILAIADGDAAHYVKVRNLINSLKYSQRLTVHHNSKIDEWSRVRRRKRIAKLHNIAREHLNECDYVFLTEDDTVLPSNALKKLLRHYTNYPLAGFIEGVQIGRWNTRYIGAWKFDDVFEPTKIESLLYEEDHEIDSGGLYCTLTRYQNYKEHEFAPDFNSDFGPDIRFGRMLRQAGYKNYIDWSILCDHYDREYNLINLKNTQVEKVKLERIGTKWKFS